MKILLWLALPISFFAAYFVLPQVKNQPEAEPEAPATQEKEPVAIYRQAGYYGYENNPPTAGSFLVFHLANDVRIYFQNRVSKFSLLQ